MPFAPRTRPGRKKPKPGSCVEAQLPAPCFLDGGRSRAVADETSHGRWSFLGGYRRFTAVTAVEVEAFAAFAAVTAAVAGGGLPDVGV